MDTKDYPALSEFYRTRAVNDGQIACFYARRAAGLGDVMVARKMAQLAAHAAIRSIQGRHNARA